MLSVQTTSPTQSFEKNSSALIKGDSNVETDETVARSGSVKNWQTVIPTAEIAAILEISF